MFDTSDVAALVQGIATHDSGVVAALSALADRCSVDPEDRTLFDVAILANNEAIIALLVSDSTTREFAAPPE